MAAGLFLLWKAAQAVLVVLVGIVAAVLFDAAAQALTRIIPVRRQFCLAAVLLIAATTIGAALWWGGSSLMQQFEGFTAAVSRLLSSANEFISRGGGGLFPKGVVDLSQFTRNTPTLLGGAADIVTTTFGIAVTIFAVFFLGAFFAWEPEEHKAALLNILPPRRRARVDHSLDHAARAMRHWMMGQAVSMLVIFIFTLVSLMLIGMPYAGVLALLAGLLTFIPTAGPFLAGVAVVLAGLSESPTLALYGLAVYLAAQFLESNLITPMVQQQTVDFPPGATLAVQLIMGALFGIIGFAFAVPLTAAAAVFVRELVLAEEPK
jgi:predicted PurR-regulated permease PerM